MIYPDSSIFMLVIIYHTGQQQKIPGGSTGDFLKEKESELGEYLDIAFSCHFFTNKSGSFRRFLPVNPDFKPASHYFYTDPDVAKTTSKL